MEVGNPHLCPATGRRFCLCSFPAFLYLRRASCGWEHPFGWDRSESALEYMAVSWPRAPQLITCAAQLLGKTGSHQPVIVRNKELAKFRVAQHQSISKHPIHSLQAWLCSSKKLLINRRLLIGSVGIPACATGQRRPKAQPACWRRGGPGREGVVTISLEPASPHLAQVTLKSHTNGVPTRHTLPAHQSHYL